MLLCFKRFSIFLFFVLFLLFEVHSLSAAITATISGTAWVCQYSSRPRVLFSASGGNTPYTYYYSINDVSATPIKTISSKDTVSVSVPTTSAGVFVYKLTSVTDGTNTLTKDTTITITVNALPSVDFTFPSNQCSGSPIQFTSSVTVGSSFSYLWEFGDGTTSTEQNPSHLFIASGVGSQNFTVKLTATNSQTGCTNSKTQTITVKQSPDASFDLMNCIPQFTSSIGIFINCGATKSAPEFEFTAVNGSTTSASNTSYTIDWGDKSAKDSIITFSSIKHKYLTLGFFDIIFTVYNTTTGCSSSKKYQVFNGNTPGGNLKIDPNLSDCVPFTVTWPIDGAKENTPGTTYTLSVDDGSLPQTFTQEKLPATISHTFTKSSCDKPNSKFTISFLVKNPCNGDPQLSYILAAQNPIASFTITPSAKTCTNKTVTFTNTSLGSYGVAGVCNTNFNKIWRITPSTGWAVSSGSLSGNILGVNFTKSGNYSIQLLIKKPNSPSTRCTEDSITQNICVEAPQLPLFTADNQEGCAPLVVKITNKTDTTGTCSPPTFKWNVFYSAGYCGTTSGFTYTNGTNSTSFHPSFNFTNPGKYTVTLTETSNCGAQTSTPTIIIVKKPPTVSINTIANGCGTASIQPNALVDSCSTSSKNLVYAWSFSGGTPSSASTLVPGTISYSKSGTYAVSLSVTNECNITTTATKTFVVNRIPILTNTELAQTICSGNQSSAITLTADTASTTFSWTAKATAGITGFTPSGTTAIIPAKAISTTASTTGTVTYTIIPKIGTCNGTPVDFVITVNPAPKFTKQPLSQTVCQNGNSDTLAVSIQSAVGAPAYKWYSYSGTNMSSALPISGADSSKYLPSTSTLGIMNYFCEITLSTGSCSKLTSAVSTITVNPIPKITTQPTPSQIICVGGTIVTPLSVAFSGGAGATSYQWYSNTTNNTTGGTLIPGETKATFKPAVFSTPGTYFYYVEIAIAGNGCGRLTSDTAKIVVVSDPVIINQPIQTQTLCLNSIADSLKVSASNGIGVYSYQWYRNGTNNTTSGTLINGATSNFLIPLTTIVGTTYYYCLITQPNGIGCSVTSNTAAVIVNPSPKIDKHPLTATYCEGVLPNQLSVEYSNGVGTPTYQWFSNAVNNSTSGTALSGQTNSTLSPPALIGTIFYYCVISLPSGGCSTMTSDVAAITVNPIPKITTRSDTICSGDVFVVNPTNGTTEIVPVGTKYKWSSPTITPVGAVTGASVQTTPQTSISQTLINKTTTPAIVKYTVTPVASSGCVGADFEVSIRVNPAITTNVAVSDITCFGVNNGSIHATISGGVPFSSGNPYTITWSSSNGFTSAASTITDLTPGVYHLSIKDAGGCPYDKDFTVAEPADITLKTDSKKDITCFGANNSLINISVTGGTGKYKFAWTKDGVSFSNSQNLSNLAPGVYVISVTDGNNCVAKTASYTIIEPPALSISLGSKTDVLCYGDSTGSIGAVVSGGTKIEQTPGVFDYSYEWTGPNGFKSNKQNISQLKAGDYLLTVTDNSGCSNTLSVKILQPTEITIGVTTTPITCYGATNATIKLNISGGNAPYTVVWDNHAQGLYQENVSAGTYKITVTDAVGCVKIKTITIAEATIFTITPVVKQITCNGAKDGSITLNFQGGKSPVSLTWSDGAITGTTRNNIGPGTYSVSISDGTPCFINKTFVIVEPQPLVVSAKIVHALDCNDANSGSIKLLVSGGTPPFSYQWSTGATTDSLSNLSAGNYLATVTDTNGCTKTIKYEVKRPQAIDISVSSSTIFDCLAKTTKIIYSADVTGGVPPYQLTWSSGKISGVNNEIMETDQNGMVVLDVTDSYGCTENYTFSVVIPKSGIDLLLVDCNSHLYQFNALQPSINGLVNSYNWDFGDGSKSTLKNPQHAYNANGDYLLKLTISNSSCVANYNQLISVEALPVLSLDRVAKLCEGDSVVVFAKGADTYKWSDGTVGDSLVIRKDGNYSVIGSSKAGCTATLNFTATYFDLDKYTIQTDKESVDTNSPKLRMWTESIPFSQYHWDFGDGKAAEGSSSLEHTFDITKEGYYDIQLKVLNSNGCTEKASKRIWISNSSETNTFTPNNDGVNDVFMKNWHIKVYNRNGLLLYEGVDGWDGSYKGQPVANDTYFYVLDYMAKQGAKVKTGFVTVVR